MKKMIEKKSTLSLSVNSPFDGSLIKTIQMQSAENARIMLEKAALLFKKRDGWKEHHERIAILNKLALLVKKRKILPY
jgi:acyl-CoA reductase-like NAD-dependent aldehyde dehydrogenase